MPLSQDFNFTNVIPCKVSYLYAFKFKCIQNKVTKSKTSKLMYLIRFEDLISQKCPVKITSKYEKLILTSLLYMNDLSK